jgi:hypothetical protein
MRIVAVLAGAVAILGGVAQPSLAAIQCDKLQPVPPQDVDRTYSGKLNAAVDGWFAKLAKVDGGAEGTYHDVSSNVLMQFPQADRLYVWDRVLYLKCQLIANSRDLSTTEKLRAVDDLADRFNTLPPPAAAPAPGPTYGSVNNSGSNATIIQGNGNSVNTR